MIPGIEDHCLTAYLPLDCIVPEMGSCSEPDAVIHVLKTVVDNLNQFNGGTPGDLAPNKAIEFYSVK